MELKTPLNIFCIDKNSCSSKVGAVKRASYVVLSSFFMLQSNLYIKTTKLESLQGSM